MKKALAIILALTLIFGVAACGPTAKNNPSEVKVGFIYIGDPAFAGFTQKHDEGRKYLEDKLGVTTTAVANVPDDDQQVFDTKARELIEQGYNVIIACSYGFGEPQYKLAQEYPEVTFLHFSGDNLAPNMGNFFGKMYEARYVAGAVTGMNIPEGGVVGYVAAFPIPEVIRMINAYTLGLRSTNPTATVKVLWTSTWFDPTTEKQAGDALVKQNVDAMTIHQDTTMALESAVADGKWVIGYHSDMSEELGDACLISAVWNLGPYYASTVQSIIDGTWKAEATWGGFEDGDRNMVMVSKVSPKAAAGSQAKADELVEKITSGELKIFTGPIKDDSGKVVIEDGVVCPDADLWGMMWFVEGVSVVK